MAIAYGGKPSFVADSIRPAVRNDPKTVHCSHCRRPMGTFASGYARGGPKLQPLCHPNVTTRPDCYKLVTLEHHEQPCTKTECYEEAPQDGPKKVSKTTRPRIRRSGHQLD